MSSIEKIPWRFLPLSSIPRHQINRNALNLSTTIFYKAGGKPWRLATARDGSVLLSTEDTNVPAPRAFKSSVCVCILNGSGRAFIDRVPGLYCEVLSGHSPQPVVIYSHPDSNRDWGHTMAGKCQHRCGSTYNGAKRTWNWWPATSSH